MLARIRAMLAGAPEAAPADRPDELQLAVAALLVEAARRDDEFDDTERTAIRRLLAERFGLADDETARLMDSALRASEQSVELYGFTRGLVKSLPYEERVHLIEMLWDVAFADGALSHHEDALIRKIAGLVYVEDFDRGAARRRVLERRG